MVPSNSLQQQAQEMRCYGKWQQMELRQQLKQIFYADIYAEYCCISDKNLQKKGLWPWI